MYVVFDLERFAEVGCILRCHSGYVRFQHLGLCVYFPCILYDRTVLPFNGYIPVDDTVLFDRLGKNSENSCRRHNK